MTPSKDFKSMLRSAENVAKFQEILKEKTNAFIGNLAVMVNNSVKLRECEPLSLLTASVVAASLDLPLDPNLGYAALVPYNEKQPDGKYISKAQFQIMYKGLVQLAMRSGQYQKIGATEIYDGQLISENPLTGDYEFDFTIKSNKIIGYAAYFQLSNGFSKTEYWDIEKVKRHGLKFSKTFQNKQGKWIDDFDAMARKTVIKNLLSKWGILSIDMQNAVKFDQAVITEDIQPIYVDNEHQKEIEVNLSPSHHDWNDAKEAYKTKSVSLDQLRQRYFIDEENEKLLIDGN